MTDRTVDAVGLGSESPNERFRERFRRNESSVALKDRLISTESANFLTAMEAFRNSNALTDAATIIASATHRFVIGGELSFAYATMLAMHLSVGLSRVTQVDGVFVRALEMLTEARDTDVLIVLSFRRYSPEPIRVARTFTERGGRVVLITDNATSPGARYAEVIIVVPTAGASHNDSPSAITSAIHILATLATASAKGARRRLALRDEIAASISAPDHTTPQIGAPAVQPRRRNSGEP